MLGTIANFAWATGGKSNQVGAATETGAGALLWTREGKLARTPAVAARRLTARIKL